LSLGHDQEVALAQELLGLGARETTGYFGILGAGDAADQAHREVALDQAADDRCSGLLCAGHKVDASLATALGESCEEHFHVATTHLEQVSELVNDEDEAWFRACCSVAAFHFVEEALEDGESKVYAGDDREEEVREVGEGEEAAGFWVDEDELEGTLAVGEGEGGDDGAGEGGLAGAGGASDEDVGDVWAGQAQQQWHAFLIESQDGGRGRDRPDPLGTLVGEPLADI
jgi:hypothetical protein